jgi:uncharacterized membrane protein YgdD (TMEM256/DUF423 family)
MNKKQTLIAGFLVMAAGVALGAFGAHALKAQLTASGRLETYELAIRYLMVHALGVILLGLLLETFPRFRWSVAMLLTGIVFFSGSLLVLSLTNNSSWGAVAPVGGTAFIVGWLHAAWSVMRS